MTFRLSPSASHVAAFLVIESTEFEPSAPSRSGMRICEDAKSHSRRRTACLHPRCPCPGSGSEKDASVLAPRDQQQQSHNHAQLAVRVAVHAIDCARPGAVGLVVCEVVNAAWLPSQPSAYNGSPTSTKTVVRGHRGTHGRNLRCQTRAGCTGRSQDRHYNP